MGTSAVFPGARPRAGMYESFYLRAVSPDEPLGVWIRHTVHKRPGCPPRGSLWCTVFDTSLPRPFMHKLTGAEVRVPAGGWIAVGELASFGPGRAEGRCGEASWSLRFRGEDAELRHLSPAWLYRTPLPRTKLTSPLPAASFDGTLELAGRPVELRGWHGMVGHNWGSEHAERWIWLHGVDFDAGPAWVDLALGRVRIAGRMTPWVASGAVSLEGRRHRLSTPPRRGAVAVEEAPDRCRVRLAGRGGLAMEARVLCPAEAIAGWRYADPDGGEHDVLNCSIAALELDLEPARGAPRTTLRTAHGAAYELGIRERDHGVPVAPFPDG